MWKVYGDLQKLNAHSIQVWRGLMGINAWNTFVLKVESLHCQKSLDMSEPTFHAEKTACYQLQQQTKVHVSALARQTTLEQHKKHSIKTAANRIRQFHWTLHHQISECTWACPIPPAHIQYFVVILQNLNWVIFTNRPTSLRPPRAWVRG